MLPSGLPRIKPRSKLIPRPCVTRTSSGRNLEGRPCLTRTLSSQNLDEFIGYPIERCFDCRELHDTPESQLDVNTSLGESAPAAAEWSETVPGKIFCMIHEAMPPAVQHEYVHSLNRLEVLRRRQQIDACSLFGGSSVGTHFRNTISIGLAKLFDVHLVMPTVIVAENDPAKQTFITDQHEVPIVAPSVESVEQSYTPNIRPPHDGQRRQHPPPVAPTPVCSSDLPHRFAHLIPHPRRVSDANAPGRRTVPTESMHQVIVPPMALLDGGIPCISRTSLNKNSAKNLGCVRDGREETGLGFASSRRVWTKHFPDMVMLECVKGLFQEDSQGRTDAAFMVEALEQDEFWAVARIREAQDCGSWMPRTRGYWGGLRNLRGDPETITAWFDTVLKAFKTPKTLTACDYIETDNDQRLRVGKQLGIATFTDLGARASRSDKKEVNWKCEHLKLCQSNGITWPIDIENMSTASFISFEGMLPREKEVAAIADILWPPFANDNAHTMEFLDVNQSIEWLCGGMVDPITNRPLPGRGPWSDSPGTLVGSGAVCVRY